MVSLVCMEGIGVLYSFYIVVLIIFSLFLWVSYISCCFPLFSRFCGGDLLIKLAILLSTLLAALGTTLFATLATLLQFALV